MTLFIAKETDDALEPMVDDGVRLRPACSRTRTFMWMALCLAGMTVRKELLGVTSIVRALGLKAACYDRLLDFFHSPALDLNKLTQTWCALIFRLHPRHPARQRQGSARWRRHQGCQVRTQNARSQETPSGIRVEHQAGVSSSATPARRSPCSLKPWPAVFALPLACRIHEGTVYSNRDSEPCWTR